MRQKSSTVFNMFGDYWIHYVCQVLIGMLVVLVGGWSQILTSLIVLIAVDYITGVFKAAKQGVLNSYLSIFGLMRKTGYLLIIIIFYRVGLLAEIGVFARNTVTGILIVHEAMSAVENLKQLGTKNDMYIPDKVVGLLERFIDRRLDRDGLPGDPDRDG